MTPSPTDPAPRRQTPADGLLAEALLLTFKAITPWARGVFSVLLVAYVFSGVTSVGPDESAVRLSFGKLGTTVHSAGLLWALPKPFGGVVRIRTQEERSLMLNAWSVKGKPGGQPITLMIETPDTPSNDPLTGRNIPRGNYMDASGMRYELPPAQTDLDPATQTRLDPVLDGYSLTGDANIIQGQFGIRYRVSDIHRFYRAQPAVETVLKALVYQAFNQEIASRRIDYALTDGREALMQAVKATLESKTAALELGIEVTAVEIQKLTPPAQVIAAFERVVDARMQAGTLLENAKDFRTRELLSAQGKASGLRIRAEGESEKLVSQATGEATAFLSLLTEYRRNPELLRTRLYWDTVEFAWNNSNSASLLPSNTRQAPTLLIKPSQELP